MLIKGTAVAGAFAMALLTGSVAVAEEKEKDQKVEVHDLPAPVRATVDAQAPGSKVLEVELEEEDGVKIYSIEVQAVGGEKVEYEISLDGKLLKTEKDDDDGEDDDESGETEKKIELGQAPAPVQAAINKVVKAESVLTAIIEEKEGGQTVYEAEYTVANVAHSLKLAASGAVLEIENAVSTATLPTEVKQAIAKKFANAQIKEAEQVTLHFYEVDLVVDGKTREIKVDASGQIAEDDEDEDEDDQEDDK